MKMTHGRSVSQKKGDGICSQYLKILNNSIMRAGFEIVNNGGTRWTVGRKQNTIYQLPAQAQSCLWPDGGNPRNQRSDQNCTGCFLRPASHSYECSSNKLCMSVHAHMLLNTHTFKNILSPSKRGEQNPSLSFLIERGPPQYP